MSQFAPDRKRIVSQPPTKILPIVPKRRHKKYPLFFSDINQKQMGRKSSVCVGTG
jgi:hypothetical protein